MISEHRIYTFHGKKFTVGICPHGTGAFLKIHKIHANEFGYAKKTDSLCTYPGTSGRRKAFGDCASMPSELSQIRRAIDAFLISRNC